MIFMMLLALNASQVPKQPRDYSYYLNGKSFNCLIANAGALTGRPGKLVTVDLTTCPRPTITETTLSSWSVPRSDHPAHIDFVIDLTRFEAECIRANRKRPERLRQAAGTDRYRLRFPCRR